MSLSIKQEVLQLNNPSYYEVNQVLKKRDAILPFEFRGKEALEHITFFVSALIAITAIFFCVFGFVSGPYMQPIIALQIAGCSLFSILVVGIPFAIYLVKSREHQKATPEELDAFFSRYDKCLEWQMKNNQTYIDYHSQLIKKAEQRRIEFGHHPKPLQ